MKNEQNTQILFEIAINQISEKSLEHTLLNALPLYQKKLRCFLVAVSRKDRITQIKPVSYKKNLKWLNTVQELNQGVSDVKLNITELFDNDSWYYSFPMADYGRLILGRKLPFDKAFKIELSKIIHQLGTQLMLISEKEANVSLSRKLIKSQSHLNAVLENTLHSIWSVDKSYCITYINDVFSEAYFLAFGKRLQLGSNILDNLPAPIRPVWKERYDKVFSGECLTFDEPIDTLADVIYIEVSGTPILQNNEITGASFFGTDITERKRTEEGRKQLLDRFEQIGDTVPGLIFQFRLKPDGSSHFPYLSTSIRRIFKLKPEILEISAEPALKKVHKEDIVKFKKCIKESAQSLKPWQDEFRIIIKDASKGIDKKVIWVEGTAIPQKESDGSILWNGYLNNINKRKHAEIELLKLSRAIEQNPASVVITNLKGYIEYVNPIFSETTGYSSEETIGKKPSILKSGLQSSETYIELWKTIKNGKTWRGELYNKKKNGELFWEMASISPVINSEGKTTHYLAVKEDITELKKAEEIILKNLDEKNVLLSEIHHRVKNNMAIIYSLLGLQIEYSNLNKETLFVIRDLQSRVKSMSVVHEMVYQNDNISKICIGQLVRKVSDNLESLSLLTD